MTDQLSGELEYSQALVGQLLACLQALSKRVAELGDAVRAAGADGPARDQLRLLLSNVQLVASIFYSLNSPGLTDVGGCSGGPVGQAERWWGRVGSAAVARLPLQTTCCHAAPAWRSRRCAGAAAWCAVHCIPSVPALNRPPQSPAPPWAGL